MKQSVGIQLTANMKILIGILSVIAIFRMQGCEARRLDRQLEILCKKDGGTSIYEKVTVSAGTFQQWHNYMISTGSSENQHGPLYKTVNTREILVGQNVKAGSSSGRLARVYSAITRRSDERLLGEQVVYIREGGFFVNFGAPDHGTVCPRLRVGLKNLVFNELKY